MRRIISAILFSFFLMGVGMPLRAAPIGFQGNPIQFPYATVPLGPGFQNNFPSSNRFFFNSDIRSPGFQPTPGIFPLQQDPRNRFFDPNLEPQPTPFIPQRGF